MSFVGIFDAFRNRAARIPAWEPASNFDEPLFDGAEIPSLSRQCALSSRQARSGMVRAAFGLAFHSDTLRESQPD
jgi:hypothetical protein